MWKTVVVGLEALVVILIASVAVSAVAVVVIHQQAPPTTIPAGLQTDCTTLSAIQESGQSYVIFTCLPMEHAFGVVTTGNYTPNFTLPSNYLDIYVEQQAPSPSIVHCSGYSGAINITSKLPVYFINGQAAFSYCLNFIPGTGNASGFSINWTYG